MSLSRLLLFAIVAAVAGCSSGNDGNTPPEPVVLSSPTDSLETTSLLGAPLYRNSTIGVRGDTLRSQLAEAEAMWTENPESVDAIVWYGRRLAYLGRYRDAVQVYSQGLEQWPDEPHLLRHRGHRFITLRRIDDAIVDFERAVEAVSGLPDEVEPDGQPNAAGIPTSTLHTNIWYHLALAYYLKGDFAAASVAFQQCFDLAQNNDMRVAAADWLYMSLRRVGLDDAANQAIEFVEPEMEILENHAYFERLLLYKGLSGDAGFQEALESGADPLATATLGYGVANYALVEGDSSRAFDLFERIVETSNWAAFGYIAAEAEVARISED